MTKTNEIKQIDFILQQLQLSVAIFYLFIYLFVTGPHCVGHKNQHALWGMEYKITVKAAQTTQHSSGGLNSAREPRVWHASIRISGGGGGGGRGVDMLERQQEGWERSFESILDCSMESPVFHSISKAPVKSQG